MNKKLEIIAELHPQHGGDLGMMCEMIRLAAMNGADVAKFQLYDAEKMLGSDWKYLDMTYKTVQRLMGWCEDFNIEFMASVFDSKHFEWCESLDVKRYKIASNTVVDDPVLCRNIIDTQKPIIASLGKWQSSNVPFAEKNISYLYCKSLYPAYIEDFVDFPNEFKNMNQRSNYAGYSDHSLGLSMCLLAISRGASIVEKHFSLDKTRGKHTERAHICSMDPDELNMLRRVGSELSNTVNILNSQGFMDV